MPLLSHQPSASVSVIRSAYVLVFVCACSAGLAPTRASAWCRASDEVGTQGECVPQPTAPFLFWKRSCIAYQFNEELFSDLELMNEREVRSAFQAGFGAWAAVDCGGRGGFFVEQLDGTTSTAESEYFRNAPNEMVVLALDRERWATLPDHSPRAIAMTLMWHNRQTGELLDTDIELNLGAGTFADCVAGSCSAGMVDLQNTIAHEAGHVLGLGHSTDGSSTMAAQTVGTVDIQKRSLSRDDIDGYCALNLPEWQCQDAACSCAESDSEAPVTRSRSGCHVAAPGSHNAYRTWLFAAFGLSLTSWRRMRRLRR